MITMSHIFDKLEHEAESAGHGIVQAAEHAEHVIASHLPHHGYHEADEPAQAAPQEDPMSVITDVKNDIEEFGAKAKAYAEDAADWAENKLPAASDWLDKAAANPAVDAVLNAVHLSPDALTVIAGLVTKMDAEIAQLQEAAAAAQAANQPPAEPAADGADADGEPAAAADPQQQTGIAV